ncbi:MAG: hypothetical protein H0U74_08930 [Bradymonadaceae bacterium]|nr:hypothetical protein [Lujinxingiaceae bacterium]
MMIRTRPYMPLEAALLVAATLFLAAPALATQEAKLVDELASQGAEQAGVADRADKAPVEAAALAFLKSQTLHAPPNLTVGQPLQVELVVEHPRGGRVILPDDFGGSRFELLDTGIQETPGERSTTTSLALTFAIFRPGQAKLPAFALSVMAPDSSVTEIKTEAIAVLVRSALDGIAEPHFAPPRPPVAIWVDDYTLAWAGGVGLGALLLAALGFMAFRRREVEEFAAPARPADQLALEKLRALKSSGLLERGEVMIYYVRMSETLREYLGRRYNFPGTELTISEIRERLKHVRWPSGTDLGEVMRWLDHCDFVKFSGASPSDVQAREHLLRALALVELTRARPTESAPLPAPAPKPLTSAPGEEEAAP